MTFLAGLPWFFGSGAFYLHVEMLTYYLVAFGLGVALGFLIWGWGQAGVIARARDEGKRSAENAADALESGTEIGRLKSELDICIKARATLDSRLEKALADLRAAEREGTRHSETVETAPSIPPAPVVATAVVPPPEPKASEPESPKASEEPAAMAEPDAEPAGPLRLVSAPDAPDDLKKIKGVGPKLEKLLNELGFYHYHQIASWSEADVSWVNARLKFAGRIERDGWVAQAKDLAGDS